MKTPFLSRARASAWVGLRALIRASAAAVAVIAATQGTQDAVANGDTRTLSIIQDHTKESLTVTFKRNGSYDSEGLKQLNWILRDWRLDEPTRMDPRLFDIVWEVYREVGAQEPVHVVSGYRSPQTNAMLRRRSRVVAEHSQHMAGKAMDFYLPDVSMSRVREIGMRLQDGGVGFYPNAFNPFVHLDAGSVRAWPRMTHDQLARLFPSGRTVHIPRDGRPMAGYELAKAEILARGGTVAGYSAYADAGEEAGRGKSLWAMLFGGGDDEDTEFYRQQRAPTRVASAAGNVTAYAAPLSSSSEDAGTRGLFAAAQPESQSEPSSGSRSRRRSRTEIASLSRRAAPITDEAPPGFESRADASLLQPVPSAEAGAARPALGGPAPATIEMVAAAPVPPRRPGDLEALMLDLPLPPTRPVALASVAGSAPVIQPDLKGLMRPSPAGGRIAGADDKTALRALFEAAVTPTSETKRPVPTSRARPQPLAHAASIAEPPANVRMVFSSAQVGTGSLDPNSFSGPAVQPLPVLR